MLKNCFAAQMIWDLSQSVGAGGRRLLHPIPAAAFGQKRTFASDPYWPDADVLERPLSARSRRSNRLGYCPLFCALNYAIRKPRSRT